MTEQAKTTKVYELVTVTAVQNDVDEPTIEPVINLHNWHQIAPDGRRLILDKLIKKLEDQKDEILRSQ